MSEEMEVTQVEEQTAPDAEIEESSPSQPEAEQTAQETTVEPEPKDNVQKRFDELTYKRREAERERDYWREQAMRQAQPEQQPQPQQPQGYADLPEPKSEDFETYDAFVDARADWRAQVNLRRYMEQQQAQTQKQSIQSWREQGRSKYGDWNEVFTQELPISVEMGATIMDSPQGHDLAYYLGKNPQEAYRIANLPAHRQAYELGKLETKLAAPPQKTKTNAPAPTSPVGGKEVPAKKPEDMDYEEYKAWRMSGGGR